MKSPVSHQRLFAGPALLMIIVALVVRFGLFASGPLIDEQRTLIDADSQRYIILADCLRQHGTFGKPIEDGLMHQAVERLRANNGTLAAPNSQGLRPEGFRTPCYPLFLAMCRTVVSDHRLPVAIQCLLGSLCAGMLFVIAFDLGVKRWAAYIAGLAWALHPALVAYDNGIVTESMFNFLTVSAIYFACRATDWRGMVLVGLLLGVAGLVRPLGLLYLPAAVVVAWPHLTRRAIPVLVAIIFAITPTLAWSTRNSAVGFGFRVSTVGDLNHLFYTASYTKSEANGEDWLAAWPKRVDENERNLEARLTPGEDVFTAARRLAVEELMDRPQVLLRVLAKSWVKLGVDHSTGLIASLIGQKYTPSGLFSQLVLGEKRDGPQSQGVSTWAALLWALVNASILLLAIVGTIRWLAARQFRPLVFSTLTLGLFLIATGAVGLERFRIPMMLPLFVAAVAAGGRRKSLTEDSRPSRS